MCNLQISQNSPCLSPWVAISTGSNDNLLSVLQTHYAIMAFPSSEVFILFSVCFPCPWLSLMLRSISCYRITCTFQCRLEKSWICFVRETNFCHELLIFTNSWWNSSSKIKIFHIYFDLTFIKKSVIQIRMTVDLSGTLNKMFRGMFMLLFSTE